MREPKGKNIPAETQSSQRKTWERSSAQRMRREFAVEKSCVVEKMKIRSMRLREREKRHVDEERRISRKR
jgi:hypothetical protein